MLKILTDCDGVLLDWETSFHNWMLARNYNAVRKDTYHINEMYKVSREEGKKQVTEFNNSAWMVGLNSFRDAVSGVAELKKAGYTFDVITSLSKDPYAWYLRKLNLESHFGMNTVSDLICLDTGADKDDALAKYEGTGYWWIEDKPENCDTGLKFGLRPILIDHLHNRWYNNPNVIRVSNWAEIVGIILDERTSRAA